MSHKPRSSLIVILLLAALLLAVLPPGSSLAQTPPTITISNVDDDEGDAGDTLFEFELTLATSVATIEDIVIAYQTADLNATLGDNGYEEATGTVTFPTGSITDDTQTITVIVNGDTVVEADEIFFLNISLQSGTATIADSQANGIIRNDDLDVDIVVNPAVVNLTEGNSRQVKLSLTELPTDNVVVDLSPGSQCSVVPTSVTLTPANFATGVNITVTATEDTTVEGNHTCTVTTQPAESAGDPRYDGLDPDNITINITDDDSDASASTATPVATFTPLPTATFTPTFTPTPPIPTEANVTNEVGGLAVRTGPYLGATLIGVAYPGFQYPILARSHDEGGEFTWFLLQMDGYTGWVSGRFLSFIGIAQLLPVQGSVYDGLDSAPDIGVTGKTIAITDIRRRPSGRSQILGTIPANTSVSIVGRTRQNGGDFWYQVRYNGLIGWVPAFVERGDTSNVPIR